MAERSPEEFINDIIIETIKPSAIIVGYDFRFGKNRAGDIHLLKKKESWQS